MKKGFTLLETVIAIAIILIMSAGFYSLAAFSNNQFKKMEIKEHGLVMIENVKNVFDDEDFVESETFSIDAFANKLQWATTLTLTTATQNNYIATCKVNLDGEITESGEGSYYFNIAKNENNITLNAKIFYNNQELYSMPDYQKEVIL